MPCLPGGGWSLEEVARSLQGGGARGVRPEDRLSDSSPWRKGRSRPRAGPAWRRHRWPRRTIPVFLLVPPRTGPPHRRQRRERRSLWRNRGGSGGGGADSDGSRGGGGWRAPALFAWSAPPVFAGRSGPPAPPLVPRAPAFLWGAHGGGRVKGA